MRLERGHSQRISLYYSLTTLRWSLELYWVCDVVITKAGRLLLRHSLGPLLHHGLRLGAHDTTSPGDSLRLVVHAMDALGDLGELPRVLVVHLGEAQGSGGLLVNDGAEPGLALDDQDQ